MKEETLLVHYNAIKDMYDPKGAEWGIAIREYCTDRQINEFEVRSFIASKIGKNQFRKRVWAQSLTPSQIEDMLSEIKTHGVPIFDIGELELLHSSIVDLFFEKELQDEILNRRDFEMGKWAYNIAMTHTDFSTTKSIKNKYNKEIAYYFSFRDYKPNEKRHKLLWILDGLEHYLERKEEHSITTILHLL